MMIMTLSLSVYKIAEYQLRQALQKNSDSVPLAKKKSTQNPTMQHVFRLFQNVNVNNISYLGLKVEKVTGLNDALIKIIRYFGSDAETIYGLT